eukprot:115836-Rhodomonas_salina.3
MSWRPHENEKLETRSDVVDFRPEILMDLASQAPPTPMQAHVFQAPPSLLVELTRYEVKPRAAAVKPKLSPRSVVAQAMSARYPNGPPQKAQALPVELTRY